MSAIRKKAFYGDILNGYHARHEAKIEKFEFVSGKDLLLPKRNRLLGPSEFWGEYSTQQEALNVACQRSFSSLQTFVYQNAEGYRKFVVAHPEIYWLADEKKPMERRCSYEVIPDGAPCHLYFDLEFSKELNPAKDGSKMTKTLIDIFCEYFNEHWGFPCKRENVVSLDSTTDLKFSRHLIFKVKNFMFKNNKHAGRFVRNICSKIKQRLLVDFDKSSHDSSLNKFSKEDLAELMVDTARGKQIFVDEGVYSRNRHFRIYKSTKWGKNSHLVQSPDSEYISGSSCKDKELGLFLDSLISYMPNSSNLVLLEYQANDTVDAIKYSRECLSQAIHHSDKIKESPYPEIDKFILGIVEPGKIRDIKLLNDQMLIYGIADNRYCANIGRPHKSNGIYWVVDLSKKVAFQRCYDFDCYGFKSAPKKLPDEICFQLDKETDILLSSVPEPQDSSVPETNTIFRLEGDSSDSELANIDLDSSIS